MGWCTSSQGRRRPPLFPDAGVPLHAWSSAAYTFPLPAGHRFPIEKYALLRDAVIAEGLIAASHVHETARATIEELERVHTRDYVHRVSKGTMPAINIRAPVYP